MVNMSSFKKQIFALKNQSLDRLKKLLIDINLTVKYASDKKRQTIFDVFLIGVTLFGGTCYYYANTIGLERYMQILRMYPDGEELPLSRQLEMLAFEVWRTSNVSHEYKQPCMVRFFPVVGHETLSVGSLKTGFGAIIGFPFNWTYNSVKDIHRNQIMFRGEQNPFINWESDDGLRLLDSLVLSANAKRFGIAREIHMSNTYRVHVNTALVVAAIASGLYIGQYILNRYKKSKMLRQFGVRLFVVRLFSLFAGVFVVKIVSEIVAYQRQLSADKAAISEGPEFLDGAVEFYEKLMARNASLYHLLGTIGQKMCTEDGEVRSLLKLKNRTRLERIKKSTIVSGEEPKLDEIALSVNV